MNTKLSLLLGGAIVGLMVLGLSQAQANKIDQKLNVEQGGTLFLDSDSGSVEIQSHDQSTVRVRVEKKGANADDFKVTITQDGNNVNISGDNNGGGYFGSNISVHYAIKVPKNYNLDIATGGGSIEVADLTGKVDARTSGGSIDIGKVEGDVELKTSGGSIRVDDVAGNIDAHTSGGSVKASISKQPTQDCRLTTSGGSVTAYLAQGIAMDVKASTSGGRANSDFEIDGTIKKTSIRGKINGGGPTLTLKTSGGSVRIKEL